MAEFQFNPIDGFKNATSFPDPSTEAEGRAQLQSLLDQLRDAINALDLDKATKAEVAAIVLGQITDGSLTDVKLSDAAGQIKDRLTTHLLAYAAFADTKGQPSGLATLGLDGKLTSSELPVRFAIGSFVGNGTGGELVWRYQSIPLGFRPKFVIVYKPGDLTGGPFSSGYSLGEWQEGGIALDGYPVGNGVVVEENGFKVGSYYNGSGQGGILLNSGTKHYIAFK